VIIRALLAAVAVAAVPIAAQDAQAPSQQPDPRTTKICEVNTTIGSRLGGVRRCRTRAEREEAKQEARQVVDRIQTFKPTCPTPMGRC
jgi:hypothetical protein